MTDFSSIEADREARYLRSLDVSSLDGERCNVNDCENAASRFRVIEESGATVTAYLCPDHAEKLLIDCEHDGTDHWAWKDECLPFTPDDNKPAEREWHCREEYERRLNGKYQFGHALEKAFGNF